MPEEAPDVQIGEEQEEAVVEAIDLGDDTLVKDPETGEPVPYSTFRENRYIPQGEYTKKTQALAEERKQLQEQAKQYSQQVQSEYQRQYQEAMVKMQQSVQTPQSGPTSTEDILRRAQQRGFATEEDLRDLVGQVRSPQGDPQTNQALQLLYEQITKQQTALEALNKNSSAAELDKMIETVREKNPVLSKKMLLDLYHSYEGDDLNDVFPSMAQERSKEVLSSVQAYQKAERERALGGDLPSVGGEAAPSKPLKISAEDALNTSTWASQLWESMQTENT